MDILNHFDSESSGDSDGNDMEDHILVEDGDHGNESKQVTTSSTQTIYVESDSSTRSGNFS